MTHVATRYQAQHLSAQESAKIIQALASWRKAYSLTDYDLAEIVGVSRDTIVRWRRRPIALSARTVERLVAGIEEYAAISTIARTDLERLLMSAQESFETAKSDPAEKLRRRLNAEGLRGNSVLAEIKAAGFSIVSRDSNGCI